MGKIPNKRNSIFPTKRKNYKPNKNDSTKNNTPSTQKPQPQQVQGPTLMDSAKSGFGFGIGSAAVHNILGSFGEMASGNSESMKRDIHTQTTALCENTLKNYNECLKIHGDKFHPVCKSIKEFMENLKCEEIK